MAYIFLIPCLILLLTIDDSVSRPAEQAKPAEPAAKEQKAETEDRLNLNVNRGHAHAVGPYGSYSGSDAETYGIEGGIRGVGFHRPLFSHTGGHGSSYANGPYAPHTYANGNTQFGNGYYGGNADAGFYGGQGVANVDSFNRYIEIPIDQYGTVFYSNLKDKTKNKNTGNNKNATPVTTPGAK